jgi:hypothetical protein
MAAGSALAVLFTLATMARAQHCSSGDTRQQVDYLFVLSVDVCDSRCAHAGITEFLSFACAPFATIAPRFATVLFSGGFSSVVHDFQPCAQYRAAMPALAAWRRPPVGGARAEHTALSDLFEAGSEKLSFRQDADVHVLFTPRDPAPSEVALTAYLGLAAAHVSLSFFFQPTPAMRLAYGSLELSVAYWDGSHFNKVRARAAL